MDKRINVILNGRQDISKVISNLKKLFTSDDKVLFYTKSEESEFKDAIKKELSLSDDEYSSKCFYKKFNEIDYSNISKSDKIKIFGIKMPNNLFRTIPTAYNDAFKFVDSTDIAEYCHFFTDDCKIIAEDKYDPSIYEWYMDTFEEYFVMDSKTNEGNYAFKKYSPRFVFISKKYLKQPISFCQFEAKEHFIINRNKFKQNFDEHLKRLYIPEFVYRAYKNGVIKHTSFFPDPVLDKWIERDSEIPFNSDTKKIATEYNEDDVYLKSIIKDKIKTENNIDPIVTEMGKIIKDKLEIKE